MFKIVSREVVGPNLISLRIYAPQIAESARAGQFVIFRIDEFGERVPLTIAGADAQTGLVRIIFQTIGKTTFKLALLNAGDCIRDFAGPFGTPTEIKKYGVVAAVAGGVGAAEVLPVINALKQSENKVIAITGARCKDLLILEEEIKAASDEFLVSTNDGSCGVRGIVTDVLKNVFNSQKIDMVYAIGPVPMMQAVADITKEKNIKTLVSLNPIMVDGTGMCGSCRVTVGGKTKFVCVDGPEFDGHLINWNELISRLALFKDAEKTALEEFKKSGQHHPECKCRQE
ncbi:sulfide/dihydroorotate dehydrogenase-like FAD/NAD-binding protein [Endomicrobium proavitum]|uniref:Ferredoxin-NADP(+) reductase subunit alpha n=1 Tax=Endomicrobium proavitum TaxID=1408281 RepID=A0A0G3WH20_9BACT|nr:sulfide/dihydroorotate dehydrogenase-like FAD/NAD-binding protein [Endomicrobium proavitum]AKL97623.1 ferredoxin-NADP(+) reductase subunit alpha [Endomicrobium proavitum]